MAAWFRSGGNDQPSTESGVLEHDGRDYVVLHNASGTMAVYRVLPKGTLKNLKRPPRDVAPDWYEH